MARSAPLGFCPMHRRRRAGGFTLIELLVVIGIISVLVALLLPAIQKARCVAKNGSCRATLEDLQKALVLYESDYGIYPKAAGTAALDRDKTVFVDRLKKTGAKMTPYFAFKDDDLVNGEFLSVHRFPYYYSFPAQPNGPDGKPHQGYEYYLWTWGCLNDPPDSDYEIANWNKN